jgi:hypothetical protein
MTVTRKRSTYRTGFETQTSQQCQETVEYPLLPVLLLDPEQSRKRET